MSKIETNIINYIVVCINEFAQKFRIPVNKAYFYLKQFKGIEFIKETYEAEHTLSIEDAIDDIQQVCINNGGNIK